MEIENPGGLYGRMTLDKLGKVSADTRNPYIANALEILGETENRCSGIPTIINAMKEYGLPEPVFISEGGIFKVILYNDDVQPSVPSDEINEILDFCSSPKNREDLQKLFEGRMTVAYVMKKYIHPMIEKGLLKMTIPDKPKSKHQKYMRINP